MTEAAGVGAYPLRGWSDDVFASEHTVNPDVQGVMFTMYTPDLPALRERLVAEGLTVSEIKRPPYMPSGEVYLRDPDSFIVSVVHWGKPEHDAWLKRIGRTDV